MGCDCLSLAFRLNLQCRRRDFLPNSPEEELNSGALQLYLYYCTWARIQAPHLEAHSRHVLVQVLTELCTFLPPCHPMHPWTGLAPGLVSGVASPPPPAGKGILRTLCSHVLMAGDMNTYPVHPLGTSLNDNLKPCKGP